MSDLETYVYEGGARHDAWLEEQAEREAERKAEQCEGHPPDEFHPMGETVYCDGSCA